LDQKKIGAFLKELRKEKDITQEQLAEQMGVSGRTVSRWETGNNMPDISLLVDIADFYAVSIPEIIDGERKSEKMDEEVKEVAEKMSDYAGSEKEHLVKGIRNLSTGIQVSAVWPDAGSFLSGRLIFRPEQSTVWTDRGFIYQAEAC